MFKELFQRAQRTVDRTIDQVVNSAIVAVPFLIAAGFATATLTLKLTQEFGAETGYLLMAALFCVIGVITFGIVSLRPKPMEEAVERVETEAEDGAAEAKRLFDDLSPADKELLRSSLTAFAPLALPAILRLFTRNLPLLIAVGGAVAYMFREQIFNSSPASSETADQDRNPLNASETAAATSDAMAA